jgi:hypothetical protein
MRYRQLDANGDYVFGHQQADFYRDVPEAVAQAVQTRLRLFTGEWFLDTTEGTPWRTQVLGKYTQRVYDATIKARILDTQGVQSIDAYASDLDGNSRRLTVTATITTIYGSAQVQATI